MTVKLFSITQSQYMLFFFTEPDKFEDYGFMYLAK